MKLEDIKKALKEGKAVLVICSTGRKEMLMRIKGEKTIVCEYCELCER